MSLERLTFRRATPEDEDSVLVLINSVYRARGVRQWTSEVDLVEGPRIDSKIYKRSATGKDNVILLAFGEESHGKKVLVGCVHLENLGNKTNLGMLSVNGEYQQFGIGAKLLAYAEDFAYEAFHTPLIEMQVISIRTELTDWYLRKGYIETGELIPFGNLAESQNQEKNQKLFFKVLVKKVGF